MMSCWCVSVTLLLLIAPEADAKKKQRFELDIPRVTQAELDSNATLRTGLHAYVLTDKPKWAAEDWTLEQWAEKIPFEWVDFYDRNMDDVGKKPHLHKLKEALPLFQRKIGVPRYMQLRLSLRGWRRIEKFLSPKPLPDLLWDETGWIDECMKKKNGKIDTKAIDNYYTTNQWKFLLVGENGTRMFFHQDGTASPSWQVQLAGRKRWTLCPHTETRFLDVKQDTFRKETRTDPKFSQALCGRVTVSPGELLYYPAYWWHHTWQLETPSIAYTGALVGTETERDDIGPDKRGHMSFLRDLYAKCGKCWKKGQEKRICDDISLKWPGAAPPPLRVVCDDYLPKCFELWDAHARTLSLTSRRDGVEL